MARIFISYSHRDEMFRGELEKHLSLLRRQGLVNIWSDHCIRPGEDLDPAIAGALEAADIILLLVSADFMSSDYCFRVEMERAVERHKQKLCVVVPIIIRPFEWGTAPFGGIKALPTDGKAVSKWPTMDDAFVDIVKQLRSLLAQAKITPTSAQRSPQSSSLGSAQVNSIEPAKMPWSSNLALPKQYTDEDKHDFVVNAFEFIKNYFEQSLQELGTRNAGISARLRSLSSSAFTAIVFRDGQRLNGCQIRIGGGFSSNGITYSANESASENSFNEQLVVGTDKHKLFLEATMGMFHGAEADAQLTDEGGAEHLWSMLIAPLQY